MVDAEVLRDLLYRIGAGEVGVLHRLVAIPMASPVVRERQCQGLSLRPGQLAEVTGGMIAHGAFDEGVVTEKDLVVQ